MFFLQKQKWKMNAQQLSGIDDGSNMWCDDIAAFIVGDKTKERVLIALVELLDWCFSYKLLLVILAQNHDKPSKRRQLIHNRLMM